MFSLRTKSEIFCFLQLSRRGRQFRWSRWKVHRLKIISLKLQMSLASRNTLLAFSSTWQLFCGPWKPKQTNEIRQTTKLKSWVIPFLWFNEQTARTFFTYLPFCSYICFTFPVGFCSNSERFSTRQGNKVDDLKVNLFDVTGECFA